MSSVTSADGTRIAFERTGNGQPVILVDGAMCYRDSGPMRPLAEQLAKDFTVYLYDRRGRGESGDTAPYSPRREIEDIEALVKDAGGSAHLFGISSGAVLALEAANAGLPVRGLALYEPPLIVDDTRDPVPPEWVTELRREVAEGRRGDAVRRFMRVVQVPAVAIFLMRFLPAWRKITGVAHTLPYDFEVIGDLQSGRPLPADRWTSLTATTLVLDGGKSPTWIRNGTRALADVLPTARYDTLPGQTHMVKPTALAPALAEFFGAH
ncbi:pimeloyl-ACP methyl ester carboxylesterase [Prauserella shujinwangii]|uniref:Pimeloyl-ACP methyl ester carboxylesterase n=1 Tax=Prauserella shujinwangii TaxID=1453103 RepID=A0A2T0M0M6_9PSEU|nr:alpha/beta hydrolase [Prauserella shujinwangii]PRX50154.1 pimeloyl-ACP methyl ester carboxylesterase [Prauserella shujinwangii]